MKTIKAIFLLATLGLGALTATAQMGGGGMGGGGTNGMGGGSMTNYNSGWWTNMTTMTNLMRSGTFTNMHQVVGPNSPGMRPGMPTPPMGGQMNMPADLQKLMQQFQADRQSFMSKQQALQMQMKDATEQQRQTLMTQMQQQMDQWKDQQAQMRQTMQDQVQQMMQRMQDQQRLMQQASQPTGPQTGGTTGGKPRH